MSETLKVICYKSKTMADGKHPLMLRICKDGKRKYQSLGVNEYASDWDFKNNSRQEIVRTHMKST